MSKFKFAVVGLLASPFAMFSEDVQNPFDLSAAGTAATQMATTYKGLLTDDVKTAVLTVMAGLAVILVLRFIAKKIVRSFHIPESD